MKTFLMLLVLMLVFCSDTPWEKIGEGTIDYVDYDKSYTVIHFEDGGTCRLYGKKDIPGGTFEIYRMYYQGCDFQPRYKFVRKSESFDENDWGTQW